MEGKKNSREGSKNNTRRMKRREERIDIEMEVGSDWEGRQRRATQCPAAVRLVHRRALLALQVTLLCVGGRD